MQQSLHHNTQEDLHKQLRATEVGAKRPARAGKTAKVRAREEHLREVIRDIEVEMQNLVDLFVDTTK